MEDKTTLKPQLVLDGAPEAMPVASEVADVKDSLDTDFAMDDFTAEEKQQIEDFSKQIDINSSNIVLQYGSGAQKKMADFSESALESVRTKDLGEAGELMSSLMVELKGFEEGEPKGIKGLFKKGANKVEAMKARYAKAETNVEKIASMLENHQVTLMKDVALLDNLYEMNKTYFKELSMYIAAGKKKLAYVQTVDCRL